MINYAVFQTVLEEQVEQDIEIILDYISENYDYEDEYDLEEILESLDEEDIEFILNEASNFGKADLGSYKPSGNQKGASEATSAPRVKVSKPGQVPAKKVKLSAPEPEQKPAEEAPKAEKPAPSKPKPRRGLIKKAADINREKAAAAERTERRKKVFRAGTPKGVRRSKGARIVDKRDVAVASIGKAVKGMHTAPAGQVQRHDKKDVAKSAVQHGKAAIVNQAKKELGAMRDRMDGKEKKPSTSQQSEQPKTSQRKPFKSKIKTAGVVTGGERDRSPEAKTRAKKVKRYLKKGTSARNVQKWVNKERKKWAKKPEAEAPKQEAPKKPKTQSTSSPAPVEPKKPRATRKPKAETQPQATATPAAEPKTTKRQRKPKRSESQEQERRSLPARSRQKIGAKEPSYGEIETIQKIRSQRRAEAPKTERQRRIAELGAKSKKGKAATPPILGKPKVKIVSSSAPSAPKKEAPKQEAPKRAKTQSAPAAPKSTRRRKTTTRRARVEKPKATKSSLPRKGEKRAVSDLSVSKSKLKSMYYGSAPEDRTTTNRQRIVRGIKGGIRKYAKKVVGKIKKLFRREDVNFYDAAAYLLISEGYSDETINMMFELIESGVEEETYACLEIIEDAVDGAMVYNFMIENYEFETENDVYDVMEQLSLGDIEYIIETAY